MPSWLCSAYTHGASVAFRRLKLCGTGKGEDFHKLDASSSVRYPCTSSCSLGSLSRSAFDRMARLLISSFVTLGALKLVSPCLTLARSRIAPTAPHITATVPHNQNLLEQRQVSSSLEICGYYDGDPKSARSAASGWECRSDNANSLWGFCKTEVDDCGLIGIAWTSLPAHQDVVGCLIGQT